MLTLTRKTDYALIALTHLAQDPGECSSAREVASLYEMPLPLLMNVLKQLSQRGLTRSVRGPRGGYTLAKDPSEITLNDIIQAVEGPIHLVRCVPRRDGRGFIGVKHGCELMTRCPVRSSIHRVHHKLIEFLGEVSLADIVEKSERTAPRHACDAAGMSCAEAEAART
jgi:Rrf2 family protein